MRISFIKRLISECQSVKKVAVFGHGDPDPDSMGACLGLQKILKKLRIESCIFFDKTPEKQFGQLTKDAVFATEPNGEYGVAIAVDCADLKLIPAHLRGIFTSATTTFCIDHHRTNARFAKYNLVRPKISSASEVIYHLFKNQVKIDADIAKCLYVGIYGDTGGFQYSNATSSTFKCLADLVSLNWQPDAVLREVFKITTLPAFNITKLAMESVKFYYKGTVAVSFLSFEDYKKTGAGVSEGKFIISYLQNLEGVKVAICASERVKGEFKVSLRTTSDVIDVTVIAGRFGGGGHKRAAGLTLKGEFGKAMNALLRETKRVIDLHESEASA